MCGSLCFLPFLTLTCILFCCYFFHLTVYLREHFIIIYRGIFPFLLRLDSTPFNGCPSWWISGFSSVLLQVVVQWIAILEDQICLFRTPQPIMKQTLFHMSTIYLLFVKFKQRWNNKVHRKIIKKRKSFPHFCGDSFLVNQNFHYPLFSCHWY